jgi:hypothetical protein
MDDLPQPDEALLLPSMTRNDARYGLHAIGKTGRGRRHRDQMKNETTSKAAYRLINSKLTAAARITLKLQQNISL